MNNSHDEIKKLLSASRTMLGKSKINESSEIKRKYGILKEQESEGEDVFKKPNITKSVDKSIEKDEEDVEDKSVKKDKQQGYRISGGILYIHSKDQSELELTTDEKIAFQETMEEFINEVSDLVDYKQMNIYKNNVEWGGNLINQNIDFIYSIGENNGVYIEGKMIKVDDDFVQMIGKLRTYYEKFKSKWAKVLANRKKTPKKDEE
jgi:hypothetical protein